MSRRGERGCELSWPTTSDGSRMDDRGLRFPRGRTAQFLADALDAALLARWGRTRSHGGFERSAQLASAAALNAKLRKPDRTGSSAEIAFPSASLTLKGDYLEALPRGRLASSARPGR
jgi:hypothetical protein